MKEPDSAAALARSGEGAWALAVLVAAAVLFLALRLPYLDLPLERDEGEYAYVAQHLLASDFVPYRDAFLHKPPAIFVAYLAALHTMGESVRGIRLFALLWMAATLLAVAALGRRLGGPLAGALAGFAFAAVHAAPSLLGPTANTEMLLLLPMVGSLHLALRAGESGRMASWALAGALAAIACWFKPLAVPHALVLVAYALAGAPLSRVHRLSGAARARAVGGLAAGAAAASAPVVGYFAARGAFEPFLDAVFLYNLGYAGALPLGVGLESLLRELRAQLPGFWSLWLLAGVALVGPWALPGPLRGWLGLWLLACFVGVSSGLYYRAHYFMVWIPPLCLLAALAAQQALLRSQASTGARATVLVLLLVVVAGPAAGHHWDTLRAESPEAVSRMLYGLNPFGEAPEIAAAIREIAGPGDPVFIVGSEPQILFHARRRSATRYILTYPLMSGDPRAGERQAEALDELRRSRPAALLLVRIPTSHLRHPDAPDDLLVGATRAAEQHYRLERLWLATPFGYRVLDGEGARALLAGPAGASWVGLALYRRVAGDDADPWHDRSARSGETSMSAAPPAVGRAE